jgi:lipoprotein
MRNLIFAILLLFSFTLVGCKKDKKDNRPPLVRANELLRKNHLPEVSKIDSVFGYEDERDATNMADVAAFLRDSLLRISYQRELTQDEGQELKEWTAISNGLQEQARKHLDEHIRNNDKEEFIGYDFLVIDSAANLKTLYFIDKDFTKVEYAKTFIHLRRF